MLPQFGPVTGNGTLNLNTFNYSVVAVIVVIGFAGIWWLVSAKNWFTGPKVQGTPEELAAIERELEVLTSHGTQTRQAEGRYMTDSHGGGARPGQAC